MLPPIQINFVVGGEDRVLQVVGSIEKRFERAAKMSVKGQQQAASQRVKAEEVAGRKVVDITERIEREKARASEKANKQRLRDIDRAGKEEIKIRQQVNALEVREAQKAVREQERIAVRASRDRDRSARSMGAGAAGAVTRGIGRVVGVAGRVAALASVVGGGFAISDVMSKGVRREALAGEIVRGADEKGGKNKRDVLAATSATAIKTGGDADDLLAGLNEFVKKTGDLKAGLDMLQDLAEYSTATGTSFNDMAGAAGEVYTKLRNVGETKDVMLALAGQGRKGAIDLRDLAQYGARLAGTAKDYAGDPADNIKKLGALAQIAKDSGLAADPAEASMAVQRLDTDLTKHAGKLHPGLVYDKAGKKKGIDDILVGAIQDTGGDERKLIKIFGERSYKLVSGLRQKFVEGGGAKGGGSAAVRAEFAKYGSDSYLTKAQVKTDVADALTENQKKINIALEQFQVAFGTKILPLLPGMIDGFVRLTPALADFTEESINLLGKLKEYMPQSAWAAVADAIGIAIGIEIGKMALGSIVEKAFLTMAASTGSTSVGSAAAGAGGKMGTAAAVLGSLAAGFTVGKLVVMAMEVADKGYQTGKDKADILAGNVESIGAAVKAGRITPEDAEARLDSIRQQVKQVQDYDKEHGSVGALVESATGTGPGFGKKNEAAAFVQNIKPLSDAIDTLTANIKQKADEIASASMKPAENQPTQPIGSRD